MSDATPAEWRSTTLGEVTRERSERVGGGPPPVVLSSTKHYGLVRSDDFFKNRTIYSTDLSNYKTAKRGWFAYATNHLAEGSIGLQDDYDDACVSPIYTVFSCESCAEPRYLVRFLKSPSTVAKYQVHEQASVNRRGSIRYSAFATIPLALPPLPEQQRIAEILDTVDEAIRSTERIVAKLASFASSWFDHVAISAEHAAQERTLNECGTWLSGGTPDTAVGRYWDGGIPWITASSLKTKYLLRSDRTLTPEGVRAGSRLVPKGTLLFVVRGMSLKSEFRVGIAGTDVAFGQDCKALRPDSELLSEYLYLVLTRKAPEVLALVDEASHGTGRLQTSLIGRLRIPILPLSAQGEIVLRSQALEDRILLEEHTLEKLRLLKRGIIADLLSGRVRVNIENGGTA